MSNATHVEKVQIKVCKVLVGELDLSTMFDYRVVLKTVEVYILLDFTKCNILTTTFRIYDLVAWLHPEAAIWQTLRWLSIPTVGFF